MFAFHLCHWFQYFKQNACSRLLITLLLANTISSLKIKNTVSVTVLKISLERSKIRETIVWLIYQKYGRDASCNLSIFLEERFQRLD